MSIPTTIKASQAQRFCIGLRQLLKECEATSCSYTELTGITKLKFADNSSIGMKTAFREAGINI